MKVSNNWISQSGSEFGARMARSGCSQLTHYVADYREWGAGRPLVLVPGLAGGHALLGPLARALARNHRVICYQLRGEDESFALRRQFGCSDLAEDLAEFIDSHFLESPIVFGVSFGAIVALEYAARYSHRLEQLVLYGTGAKFQSTIIQRIAGMVLKRFPLPNDSPFINQFFNLLFGGKRQDPELFNFVVRNCWRTDQSVMSHRFRLVEQFDMEDRLHRISAPTLIFSGDKDLVVTPRSLAALCNGIPNSQLVRFPEAGHLGFVTDVEQIARKLSQFVNAIEANCA